MAKVWSDSGNYGLGGYVYQPAQPAPQVINSQKAPPKLWDAITQFTQGMGQDMHAAVDKYVPNQYEDPRSAIAKLNDINGAGITHGLTRSVLENRVPTELAAFIGQGSVAAKAAQQLGSGAGPNLSINPNLNAELLDKYLAGKYMRPSELDLYESQALAMETPQLQRYNLANANAQGGTQASRAKELGFDTDVYHGTNSEIKAADYQYSGGGNDQYGSAALYTGTTPDIANGYVKEHVDNGNVLPLMLRGTGDYMSSDLEKKLTATQIRKFINQSPDEYALSNFGDVGYEGKAKVVNSATKDFIDFARDDLLGSLHMINNDFYNGSPEAFNTLAGDMLKKKGVSVDVGGGSKFLLPWETKDIRSRFAAFDPLRKHSSSILGSLLGGTVLANEYKKE